MLVKTLTIRVGRKLNLGNFNQLEIMAEATIEVDPSTDQSDQSQELFDWCDEQLKEAASKQLKGQQVVKS